VLESRSGIVQDLKTGAMLWDSGKLAIETSASAIPADLLRAYQTTAFCATVDGRAICVRPGDTNSELDQALRRRRVTSWAFITAWNPGSTQLSRRENDIRHDQLKNDLAHLGLEVFEGQGEPANPGWPPERSLLVLGISAQEAVAIGRRYGQIAIVVGETAREATLLGCTTSFRNE